MHAASRAALAEARDRLAEQARGASGEALLALAHELFAVARLLGDQPTLRRALSDPAAKAEDRAGLAGRLLTGKVSDVALDVVQTVARQRWSRPVDLVEATETLGTEAALDAAEARRELAGVEDELVRFGRIVAGDSALSLLLSDPTAPAKGKTEVLERLLSRKTSPVTLHLLRNVLTGRHVGTAEVTIEKLSEAASARRGRSVAHVTTAVALTDAQQQRLSTVLGRIYGRTIGLQVTVDPDLLGGLVIRVGDEVIDGSIADRLEDARRRLAG